MLRHGIALHNNLALTVLYLKLLATIFYNYIL